MRTHPALVYTLSLFVVSVSALPAQTPPPSGPPKVLQIIREEVKPGKAAEHERVEAGWPRAFAKAQWPTHYLGMTSLAGPNEAWFLVGFPSLAAWEKDNQNMEKATALTAETNQLSARDGELLTGIRNVVATYIDSLSYQPNVDLAKMRYFQVITFRVRPGHSADFARAAKMYRAAYEKVRNVPAAWATYQVVLGMPEPTYLVFIPAKSLSELDENPANDKAFEAAMGAENWDALRKISTDAYLNTESDLFAFNPKMSYPSREFVARDPGFWSARAVTSAKPSTNAVAAARDSTKRGKP